MKEKVLVVAPTTASRLPLLKEVLGKLYDNNNLDIKTIVVKNGLIQMKNIRILILDYPI